MRRKRRPRRVPHLGRVRRGGRAGSPGRGRARRPVRRARHPARRPERPGRGVHTGTPLRPDRRAVPTGRRHCGGEPIGQLRFVVPQLVDGHGHRHQPGGVSRNAAATSVADFLGYYADDDATKVALAYVEGIPDGRAFFEQTRAITERKPLVLVKGGSTAGERARHPATPDPWQPTTASSTAHVDRPASLGPATSRARSKQPPPSQPNLVPRAIGSWS